MRSRLLSYLGGVFDCSATISCGSDAVTDLVTGQIITSATSSCRICTRPPVLLDRACSTDILAPQPSQVAGISNRDWLYLRRRLSLHSSANRPVTFNQPCTSVTVPFVPSHHKWFAPAASLKEDLLILESISSRQIHIKTARKINWC